MKLDREAKALAEKFHETYERLAPSFGYETRKETRQFDPESTNGRLMIAVCRALLDDIERQMSSATGQVVAARKPNGSHPDGPARSAEPQEPDQCSMCGGIGEHALSCAWHGKIGEPQERETPRTIEEIRKDDKSGWTESLYNCTTGDNYLKAAEYFDLIQTLDLYARELSQARKQIAENEQYRKAWHEWRSLQTGDVQKLFDAALRCERAEQQLAEYKKTLPDGWQLSNDPVAWIVSGNEHIPYPHIERLVDVGQFPSGTKLYAMLAASPKVTP